MTHDVSFINNVSDGLLMIEDYKLKSFEGNLAQFKKSKERTSMKTTSDDFLIDFRLTSISNRLVQNISKEEREELEAEYEKLIQQKEKQ